LQIVREQDVGGRKTDRPPDLIAMCNAPFDFERAAEKRCGMTGSAFVQ